MKKLICKKCGNEVLPEKDKALKKEYPYYCSFCDENKYRFECMRVEENKAQKRKELIWQMKKEYYPASVRSKDFGVWSGSMKKKEDCFLHGWKRKAKYRLKTRLDWIGWNNIWIHICTKIRKIIRFRRKEKVWQKDIL